MIYINIIKHSNYLFKNNDKKQLQQHHNFIFKIDIKKIQKYSQRLSIIIVIIVLDLYQILHLMKKVVI